MPLYDFKCDQCGTKNEIMLPMGTTEIKCNCGGIAYKQVSAPKGFNLKGDGWYKPSPQPPKQE